MLPLAKREQLKGVQQAGLASQRSPTSSSFTKKGSLPDPSLVIGVGAGALYMLISCREEKERLNKTVQQTEHLLLELSEQCQRHHEDLISSSCSGSYSMHSTNVRTALCQGVQASMSQTGQLSFATRICNKDPILEEQVSATQGVAKDQMAALAAELEAELELMELNINAGDILFDQSSIHDGGDEVCIKGIQNSYLSDTSSRGMVETSNVGRCSARIQALQPEYGVSPMELDHRLREVLEAQQQERILELEQLLKETEAKLLAKEHEISGWKNHVNSLANLVEHASACGTHVHKCVYGNGVESANSFAADVPEVTKNTLEILHSFQDPPISTEIEFGESTSNSNSRAKVPKQETNKRSRSPPRVFFDDGNCSNKASYFSTASHEGSLVRECNCCWDGQDGPGNDTPVFVVLDELNAHITAQKAESFRGQAVSKALEIGNSLPHDVEAHVSSHGLNGHSDSSPIARDGESTASSGIKMIPSSLPHMSCKIGMIETSLSSFDFEELGKGSSDIKHSVNSFKLKPDLNNWKIVHEGMGVPKRGLKSKNESIQILTRSLRRATSQNGSLEGTSSVLDKIRHYEAFAGSGQGKRL